MQQDHSTGSNLGTQTDMDMKENFRSHSQRVHDILWIAISFSSNLILHIFTSEYVFWQLEGKPCNFNLKLSAFWICQSEETKKEKSDNTTSY